MNFGMQMSFKINVFTLSRILSINGIAGLYDSFVFSFFLQNHVVFHIGHANLHSHSLEGFPFLHILSNICYL